MTEKNKSRILIVDDNPFNRSVLKGIIVSLGYEVTEAQNGKQAIDYIAESSFQLILLDLLMPGMDGFETMRRIRNMGVQTPIIIVSAMSDKEDRQRCIEAGANDFLEKPVKREKLLSIIQNYKTYPQASQIPLDTQNDEPSLKESSFSKFHILLAEEDSHIATRLKSVLVTYGFNVTCVPNGNKAYELISENRNQFQIFISNMFTSEIDGIGILGRLKRNYPHILVFIYAETYDPDAFQLAIQLGADGVLTLDEFGRSIIDMIESAVIRSKQKGSRVQTASTISQIRKAQQQLVKYGCPQPCESIDIAFSSLTDAGGDLACCRRFNRAGRCGVILGDVSGHDVTSSYISAFFLGILSSNWDKNQNPIDLLKKINIELNKSDYPNYHLCASALLWDQIRKKIRFACAGNPGSILVTITDQELNYKELLGGGMCLGLLYDDKLFINDNFSLQDCEYLFMFSDGITKEQLIEILDSGQISLQRDSIRNMSTEILDGILRKWGQKDDMILISLRHPSQFQKEGWHYSFKTSYHEVDKACNWVQNLLATCISPTNKDPYFILMAVREALINAVMHGNHFNPNTYVDLSIYDELTQLRFEISDEGTGFILPKTIKRIEEIDLIQSGGRGLPVIVSVADQVKVEGATVSMIFKK